MPRGNFIIEHLEDGLPDWAFLEYKHICMQLLHSYGPSARIVFTNTDRAKDGFQRLLQEILSERQSLGVDEGQIRITPKKALSFVLHEESQSSRENARVSIFILDPFADAVLEPNATNDGNGARSSSEVYFVFGGILGNHPMNGRTYNELTKEFLNYTDENMIPIFSLFQCNLGSLQLTTDTAVLVTALIFFFGVDIGSLACIDNPKFRVSSAEKIKMTGFRYLRSDGSVYNNNYTESSSQAIIPKGMLDLWRRDFTIFE